MSSENGLADVEVSGGRDPCGMADGWSGWLAPYTHWWMSTACPVWAAR
jgi:hypothetical protein